jgi:hypothetical protein
LFHAHGRRREDPLPDGLELTNTVNNLGTKLDDPAVTVNNLGTKVDRPAPLAPASNQGSRRRPKIHCVALL